MKLSKEQASALAEYRAQAGRKWREELMRDWMRGGTNYRGEWAHLQEIRRAFGARIFFEEVNND